MLLALNPTVSPRVDSANVGLHGRIRDGFLKQASACRAMESPFTASICELLADRLDDTTAFGRRISNWTSDPMADALPLRAAGGFNDLVLRGLAPELAACYPPRPLPTANRLGDAIVATLREHDEGLAAFLQSPPQTNEAARSAAILVAALALAGRFDLPLETYEVGASAGLNLWFDRYRYEGGRLNWGDPDSPVVIRCDWTAALPNLRASLVVADRHGCDQRPLDPASAEDRRRLLCYVWPDQTARVERIRAALDFATQTGVSVKRADAADWVERHFGEPKPGAVKTLVHTVVWQYLPQETRKRITRAVEGAGSQATDDAGIAWIRLEADGESPGAGLRLRSWPGGEDRLLTRFDFHGRWAVDPKSP